MTGLRDHLQSIYDEHGKLTPPLVVELATVTDHPLHSSFEWDDSRAAHAHRLEQAHELIRRCRVVYREADEKRPEQSVRAFQAVRDDDGYAYKPADEVAGDPFLTKLVLADMQREWKQLKRRYDHFAEFTAMVRRDVAS